MYKHVAKYTEGRYCITIWSTCTGILNINDLNFLITNKKVYAISK